MFDPGLALGGRGFAGPPRQQPEDLAQPPGRVSPCIASEADEAMQGDRFTSSVYKDGQWVDQFLYVKINPIDPLA